MPGNKDNASMATFTWMDVVVVVPSQPLSHTGSPEQQGAKEHRRKFLQDTRSLEVFGSLVNYILSDTCLHELRVWWCGLHHHHTDMKVSDLTLITAHAMFVPGPLLITMSQSWSQNGWVTSLQTFLVKQHMISTLKDSFWMFINSILMHGD